MKLTTGRTAYFSAANADHAPLDADAFGSLTWREFPGFEIPGFGKRNHVVRSPIAVRPVARRCE